MEDNPHDATSAEHEGREGPPLFNAPLLTALMLMIVLPLLTLLVLFLMWVVD
jgi:hypothetical protein